MQNMKQLGGAIKQIVGRGPNAVALREFHRRLNSGVRLRIALRWAFNFELRPAGGRIMTRNAASLRRDAVCMFCFVYSVAERALDHFPFFCAIDHRTRLIFLIGM